MFDQFSQKIGSKKQNIYIIHIQYDIIDKIYLFLYIHPIYCTVFTM